MARITAPNRGYNGMVGDVVFVDGVAETDDLAVISYCRGAGYEIDGQTDEQEDAVPVDSREVTTERTGTALRDAAVDPRPDDFLPPVNAGQADPHGPAVVAPSVHAAPPAPIVPGPVPDDPGEQAARETEVADRVLVQGQPATVVVRPPQAAPKADWVAYAVAQGADQVEAEASTKRDLIAAYGTDGQADDGEDDEPDGA